MRGVARLASSILVLLLFGAAALVTGQAEARSASASCAGTPVRAGQTIRGTPCADVILVPPDVEKVYGGGGNDTILAASSSAGESCPEGCRLGVGSQTFEGGPGDDIVYGERGNDILRGGEGNDRLYGGIGDDRLEGGPGDDFLSGGFGADALDGGLGDDYVRGDGTQDEIVDTGPESDVDTLSYSTGVAPGFTRSVSNPGFPPSGGERGVYLDLSANLGDNGVAPNGGGVDNVEGADFERIVGSAFSDYIVGSKPGQTIFGGAGADVLIAKGESDHLFGGADGDDCSGEATKSGCESEAEGGPVSPRDTAKVSVGLISSGETNETQLYFLGSSGHDEVTLSYEPGSPATVTFGLSGSSFDTSASAGAGCEIEGGEAVCPVAGTLDSVLLAGVGGGDALDGSGLPASASLIVLGGSGNDTLTGGEESDDTLVDGPGDDALHALGGDDALLNNEGADRLFGEDGNDLFLSNRICEGDLINGGEGRDNASWAKFGEAVEARIGSGDAGRPGLGGGPQCEGGFPDTLQQVEDLEGSSSGDVLYGGPGPNQLLGHSGPDSYFAGVGEDSILANSGDADPVIDCGESPGDVALVDHPAFGDAVPIECETVQEADPNSFRIETRLPVPPVVLPPPATPPPAPPGPAPPPPRQHQAAAFHRVKTVGQFAHLPRRERRRFAIQFMTTHPVDPCTRPERPLSPQAARRIVGLLVRNLHPGRDRADGTYIRARTPVGNGIRHLLANVGC
jgi:Ca2+-binding RTX toxin-like protein